ncbi:hypothetical protein Ais01nite_82280 [Asanoa ishikariensis]|nr:hypothetical protein Ais01nite_82280 [Asanoa ishikariensis]
MALPDQFVDRLGPHAHRQRGVGTRRREAVSAGGVRGRGAHPTAVSDREKGVGLHQEDSTGRVLGAGNAKNPAPWCGGGFLA